MGLFGTEGINVDIFGGVLTKALVVDAADGESGRISVRLEELLDKSRLDVIVAIDEADIIASGFT